MYLAGRLAHGIHGKGDGRWEEKENDYENEERSSAEKWPTADTEKGMRGGNRRNGKGRNFFTTRYTKDTKGGGRGFAHGIHGIYGKIEVGEGAVGTVINR